MHLACSMRRALGMRIHQSIDLVVGDTQAFVGKIWVSTDSSSPLGTFQSCLPDGTLVMDSCVETYRLAKWRAIGSRRVESAGSTAKIQAGDRPIVPRRASTAYAAGRAGHRAALPSRDGACTCVRTWSGRDERRPIPFAHSRRKAHRSNIGCARWSRRIFAASRAHPLRD